MSNYLPEALLATVAENAKAVDKNEKSAAYVLELLRDADLTGKDVKTSVNVIRELSREDLSVGFTTWATFSTYTFLVSAGTAYGDAQASKLVEEARPGVTGMAGSFKELAGAGEIDLTSEKVEGGYRINGKLGWASNLYDNAIVVTGAKDAEGNKIIFSFEAGHEGVGFGRPFGLLGLNATQSSWATFDDVFIPQAQVLTENFREYMLSVRSAFVLGQIAECLGVAEAANAAAESKLTGIKETFRADHAKSLELTADVARRWEALVEKVASGEQLTDVIELLELRLDASDAAVTAANIEVRVAGGAGYASSSSTSRRYREASFIPVQSPSEAQLRFQLEQARAKIA
ncbi:acyl-CoA dehydrogenase family protein [Corynebacterium guangdongense]|uniref:Alkylation response protein AidB-like acyl-CoA dehydrogenase n=1 Tax=Corynebacterium guangdongense TaxID=1783348 RepID=A0ABU2A0X5_9CORY|nr:acyl-CoA dehydrogenase family protein [Corynebacterium guangdongense]MDR7330665.1 alkylation response protein AidB-like acyl-CoA dehydrogenase [Corynebacterium guangdongense]WJZ16681.1 Acyl-CoA dehydrogenase, short-chain specific [Corynebacterium guangdongense]